MENPSIIKQRRMTEKKRLLNRKKRNGFTKHMFILRKHRLIRRWLVRNPWMRPMTVFNYAAVRIQAIGRSFVTRNRLSNNYNNNNRVNINSKSGNASRQRGSNRQLAKYLQSIETYSTLRRPKPKWLDGGFSSWCAVRIQAWARMVPLRRRFLYKNHVVFQIAALVIQSAYRNILFRRIKKQMISSSDGNDVGNRKRSPYDCALCIQLMWRRYCNKRVYKYFRDLIVDKLTGAPSELLRTIIPNESCLLDRAAGVHVRFRLGGSVFPPKVLFKIYTHRPLCDVNAFAPRNYVEEKEMSPFDRHNKSAVMDSANLKSIPSSQRMRVGVKYFDTVVTSNVGIDRWYQREENNPWRCISSQILTDMFAPNWLKDLENMKKKSAPFHFSQLRRKQDVLLHKKRRRRQWMVKAYLLGNSKEDELLGGVGNVESVDRSSIISWVHQMEAAKEPGAKGGVSGARVSSMNSMTDSTVAPSIPSTQPKYVDGGMTKHNVYVPKTAPVMDAPMPYVSSPPVDVDPSSNEELLKWSAALDFDEYSTKWSSIATTYSRHK